MDTQRLKQLAGIPLNETIGSSRDTSMERGDGRYGDEPWGPHHGKDAQTRLDKSTAILQKFQSVLTDDEKKGVTSVN